MGTGTPELELDQTMQTDDCSICDGTTEARTVDYYRNIVWACTNCGALL